LNDWNYMRKAGKIVVIYAIAIWLFISTVDSLTGIPLFPEKPVSLGFLVFRYLLGYLILFGSILTAVFIYPGMWISLFINFPFPSLISYNPKFLSYLIYGATFWMFLGFLIDLNKKNREDKREKGIFLRIPLEGRNIIISERFVNCLIVAEIIILVIFTAFTSM